MKIDVPAFVDSLQYMLKGMAGVFLVTGFIILAIYLLDKIASRKDGKE